MRPVGIVGGTGPEGLGLALRLAAAGEPLVIGSRSLERAEIAAEKIRAAVPRATVAAATNDDAVLQADPVVVAIPYDGLAAFLAASARALDGKLVVDVVVPLRLRGGLFERAPTPDGESAGEAIQRAAPGARVVSAFKTLPAARLADLSTPLEGDALVSGDDPAARARVLALVAKLPGVRGVDAGPLRNARAQEAVTALLLNLNREHRALTSIAILGL
jgi:NADPH-dependent F420 reductase